MTVFGAAGLFVASAWLLGPRVDLETFLTHHPESVWHAGVADAFGRSGDLENPWLAGTRLPSNPAFAALGYAVADIATVPCSVRSRLDEPLGARPELPVALLLRGPSARRCAQAVARRGVRPSRLGRSRRLVRCRAAARRRAPGPRGLVGGLALARRERARSGGLDVRVPRATARAPSLGRAVRTPSRGSVRRLPLDRRAGSRGYVALGAPRRSRSPGAAARTLGARVRGAARRRDHARLLVLVRTGPRIPSCPSVPRVLASGRAPDRSFAAGGRALRERRGALPPAPRPVARTRASDGC